MSETASGAATGKTSDVTTTPASGSARFLVGIDLGTTNSAVAFVDLRAAHPTPAPFDVVQLTAPGDAAPRRTLPSAIYLADAGEFTEAGRRLPWTLEADATNQPLVGAFARNAGAHHAERLIASAKSWLGHHGVDRQAAILPWGTTEGAKLSPVAALAAILRHIAAAWNHAHPDAALARQDVVITVPASFDEAARDLVLHAARQAGYPDVTLLEEPLAAFYAHVARHGARELAPGSNVLVFDMGGGTTDFSLIAIANDGSMNRTAVGDHILLGGDNIDLALAKGVEQRLTANGAPALDMVQWHALVLACKHAKEQLLAGGNGAEADADVNADDRREPVVLPARGSKLVAQSRKDHVSLCDLRALLYDGFFPMVAADATPARARAALHEFGLPYAADAAVTRHLAAFLRLHQVSRIDAVLFNGGAMIPAVLRARVLAALAQWFAGQTAPRELAGFDPDLAVALGAAHYGLVRRGIAASVGGGMPRNYYVGVKTGQGAEAREVAMCIAPKGAREGSRFLLPQTFSLVTNRPVAFRLFATTERMDEVGTLHAIDRDVMLELPPIVTALRGKRSGAATISIELVITELGRVELWCNEVVADGAGDDGTATPGRWRLSFDARNARETLPPPLSNPATSDASAATPASEQVTPEVTEAKAMCRAAFAASARPTSLFKQLEQALGGERNQWGNATTRALFDELIGYPEARQRSADHEQRWLVLAGFCLRPGTGAPLDAWRIRQLWGVFQANVAFAQIDANRQAWWVMWRRVAGGLGKGQQEQLYDRLAPMLLPGPKQAKLLATYKPSKPELGEMWRCLASLEALPPAHKQKLADQIVTQLEGAKARGDAMWLWCLARLAGRAPLHGTLDAVLPPATAMRYARALLAHPWPPEANAALTQGLVELGRRTGDRARDLADGDRAHLREQLVARGASPAALQAIDEVVALDSAAHAMLLGDALPPGLVLATP